MVVKFILEAWENDQAILKDDQGEVVVWPKAKLPVDVSIGATLYFNILPQKDLMADSKPVAEGILNEILNID